MRTLPGLLALTLLTACIQEQEVVGRSIRLRVVTDHSAKTGACDVLAGSLSSESPAGGTGQTAVVDASARPGEVTEREVQALFGPAQEFTASARCQVWLDPDLRTVGQVSVTRTVTEEDFVRGLTLRVTPPTEIGERPGFVLEPFAVR